MRVIFIIGAPWSGKTTQALMLARRLGYEYCSPGDWLRIERDRDTPLGEYISNNYGSVTIDPLVIHHVACKVRDCMSTHNSSLVVDGFPRTVKQLESLAHVCANNYMIIVDMRNVSQNEATRRAMTRAWAPPIGSCTYDSHGDDATSADYHVLTIEDTQRRYTGYSLGIGDLDDPSVYACDASMDKDMVHEQVCHIITGSGGVGRLLPVMLEPIDTVPMPATAVETAIAIQQSMRLVGRRSPYTRQFVGSHPVSLQREHLANLVVKYSYLVSRKWDGERVLLLFYSGRMWVLMRNYTVLRCRWQQEIAEHWENTLIDAEWLPRQNKCCIIDCVAICGSATTMQLPILQRLHAARDIIPVIHAVANNTVVLQRYYALADMRYMLRDAIDGAACDGIVFTAQSLPYRAGRDKNMFKWKRPEDNTVDLMYRRDGNQLFVRQTGDEQDSHDTIQFVPIGVLAVCDTDFNDNAILECLALGNDMWRCVKERKDRVEPNADWVARRVCESVRDDITLDELCNLHGVR